MSQERRSESYAGLTEKIAGAERILYRDDDIIAIMKPSGLPVHKGAGDPADAATALRDARRLAKCRVYPVHRLDRATSGVLLFALSPESAARMNDAFTNRLVTKSYLAIVRGTAPAEEIVDHPLAEEPDRRNGHVRGPEREAVTAFRRLASVELPVAVGRYPSARYSLVEAKPLTGRRHQIRRHLKHLSHPIVGDTTYGDGRHNRLFREMFGSGTLLLSAVEIAFPHPGSGAPLAVTAPVDGSLSMVIDRFGWGAAVPERWLRNEER